jgi:hypothetical protein
VSDRATAIAVGVLFILASVTAVVGGSLLLPITEGNGIEDVGTVDAQLVTGAVLEMVLVLSVVGIAVLLFPVLRRHNEGAALGYVGARTLEGVLLLAATLSALVVVGLLRDGIPVFGQPVGDLVLAVRDWTYLIGSLLMFGVSALILYTLLFRAGLVPAWLSLWGLIGGALIVVRGLLDIYGVVLPETVAGLLVAPIGLNEMVLAVWLIVKGFDTRALATETVKPAPPASAQLASAQLPPGRR